MGQAPRVTLWDDGFGRLRGHTSVLGRFLKLCPGDQKDSGQERLLFKQEHKFKSPTPTYVRGQLRQHMNVQPSPAGCGDRRLAGAAGWRLASRS